MGDGDRWELLEGIAESHEVGLYAKQGLTDTRRLLPRRERASCTAPRRTWKSVASWSRTNLDTCSPDTLPTNEAR